MIFSKLQSELVVSNHIFQFLSWNDLLRLRRVCKDAKILAEDHLRLYGTLKRFIGISDKNISDFLALPAILPISRLCLQNSDNSFLESEQLQTLLNLYEPKITHLNINILVIPINRCSKAVECLNNLPNLRYLEIDELRQQGYEDGRDDPENGSNNSSPPDLMLPSPFKRLRHLQVSNYRCHPNLPSVQYLWSFLEECSSHLETILLPALPCTWKGVDVAAIPGGEFGCVRRIVERRHEENPNDPNLKEIDLLEGYETIRFSRAASFYELVSTCDKFNVKLANVNALLIEGMMGLDTPDKADHGRKISSVVTSLYGIHSSSFLWEMPHLTKICINDGEHGTSLNCSMPPGRFERQAWSNLKEVNILVDSESVVDFNEDLVATSQVLHFFFKGIRREKLETLKLSFSPDEDQNCKTPIPRMRDVCASCPNLKILKICNWLGTNKAISKLWGNLPLLEKLTFKNCENLGNVAFVGEDQANPGILKMKRLRTLKLSGLEEMPKITDFLFTSVLRRMPLNELSLKSNVKNTPLTSITIAGISSLLDGEFAKSIEKLKLHISLEDVTDDALTDLGKLFRSSKML